MQNRFSFWQRAVYAVRACDEALCNAFYCAGISDILLQLVKSVSASIDEEFQHDARSTLFLAMMLATIYIKYGDEIENHLQTFRRRYGI